MAFPIKNFTTNSSSGSIKIPEEVVKEFAQLTMKDSSKQQQNQQPSSQNQQASSPYFSFPRHNKSRSNSSCSSLGSQRSNINVTVQGDNIQISGFYNEDAIVDDYEESTKFGSVSTINSPNLLATSVENNIPGKLLPSLSTISLLSLNREQNNGLESNNVSSPELKTSNMSRNTSFSHSRVSSFHQQRHPSFYMSQHRRLSNQQQPQVQVQAQTQQQQQHQFNNLQPISISNSKPSLQINTPETPNLGPMSLSGSPSGFVLSNQTSLPASLQRANGFPPSFVRNNSYIGQNMASPLLHPTQTNEVPMTPLMLSSPPPLLEDDEKTNDI